MTENEKRILTVLSKQGPLSKREISEQGRMGWATVVKMLDRLEEAGTIECVGAGVQAETSGKNPLLYALVDRQPLAVGIDVSYSTTHIILSNLKHDILAQQDCPTPQTSNIDELQAFLVHCCSQFLERVLGTQERLVGIGVGFPLWLLQGQESFVVLQQRLEQHFQCPVLIENNIRSYTMYKKWVGKAFGLDNFILITIRSGIGSGIFQQGQLVRGVHGMAGELSHLPIVDNGKLCRCGKSGCLETVVNQDLLYRQYVEQILKPVERLPGATSETQVEQGLSVLFSLAKQGQPEASGIVRKTASYLGKAIASLILLFDIPDLFIAGNFGPDGDSLNQALQEQIAPLVLSGNRYTLSYTPLERLGFAHGAALLILDRYFSAL